MDRLVHILATAANRKLQCINRHKPSHPKMLQNIYIHLGRKNICVSITDVYSFRDHARVSRTLPCHMNTCTHAHTYTQSSLYKMMIPHLQWRRRTEEKPEEKKEPVEGEEGVLERAVGEKDKA